MPRRKLTEQEVENRRKLKEQEIENRQSYYKKKAKEIRLHYLRCYQNIKNLLPEDRAEMNAYLNLTPSKSRGLERRNAHDTRNA